MLGGCFGICWGFGLVWFVCCLMLFLVRMVFLGLVGVFFIFVELLFCSIFWKFLLMFCFLFMFFYVFYCLVECC